MIIEKMYAVFKTEGIGGIIRHLYYHIFPQRMSYIKQCKPLIEAGIGLEIGGPSSIFSGRGNIPVYSAATRIDNCNFGSATVWEGAIDDGLTFKFSKRKNPGRQYLCEASDLSGIESASYDFVLSSHCIEHLANPFQGLAEWIRVLKPGGLMVLVFPHKDGTFDHRRPITLLDHLINDYVAKTGEDDMTHFEEVLALHDFDRSPGVSDLQEFRARSLLNVENRCLHHHVFDTALAIEMVHYMGLQIKAVELFHPFHIAVIASNPVTPNQAIDNEAFRSFDPGLHFG
ncbi:MAG: methyltransferase domain-containing protein [Halioglobus sp.]|nr:methyltransferase domain-containing protein [Halioglobus sp.]